MLALVILTIRLIMIDLDRRKSISRGINRRPFTGMTSTLRTFSICSFSNSEALERTLFLVYLVVYFSKCIRMLHSLMLSLAEIEIEEEVGRIKVFNLHSRCLEDQERGCSMGLVVHLSYFRLHSVVHLEEEDLLASNIQKEWKMVMRQTTTRNLESQLTSLKS